MVKSFRVDFVLPSVIRTSYMLSHSTILFRGQLASLSLVWIAIIIQLSQRWIGEREGYKPVVKIMKGLRLRQLRAIKQKRGRRPSKTSLADYGLVIWSLLSQTDESGKQECLDFQKSF